MHFNPFPHRPNRNQGPPHASPLALAQTSQQPQASLVRPTGQFSGTLQ